MTGVTKIYEKVIVTPYKEDGYQSLIREIEKVATDVGKIDVKYNDQYLVRVTIEKLDS